MIGNKLLFKDQIIEMTGIRGTTRTFSIRILLFISLIEKDVKYIL